MPDYTKYRSMLHHLLLIDDAVRSGEYPNASTLARELELSPRTIARKIEFLRDVLRAPLEYDPRRKGYYYSEPNWSLPGIRLTEGELLGVVMAQMALRAYKGTPLGAYLQKIVAKLLASLPDEIDVRPSEVGGLFRFHLGPAAPVRPEHWELLARAARERRTVRMRYYILGKDRTVERLVDPYLLRCSGGDWYVIGHDHRTGHVPVFNLARIRRLRLTNRRFRVRRDFDADAYLAGVFGAFARKERHRVRVQFRGQAARLIRERVWHASQKLTERRDGSVVLELVLADLGEIGRWVMTWGADAKVLAPPALRDFVRDTAASIAVLYDRAKGGGKTK